MNLTELTENAFRTAKGIIEGGDELTAVFMIEDFEGDLHILMCPMGGNREKDIVFALMRKYLQDTKAKAYVFVTEAWTATCEKGKDDGIPPSERDDRVEVLMVDGFTREGEHVCIFAEIKDRKVMEPDRKKVDSMTGRGACLFHREEDLQKINEAVN